MLAGEADLRWKLVDPLTELAAEALGIPLWATEVRTLDGRVRRKGHA
jgi:hypothetical protein